ADKGTVIAASYWEKFKTVFQMAMTILMIIDLPFGWAKTLTAAVMWIAVILTVVSLADYVIRNRKVLGEED
ncbi:MAG: CDP-diacylglycerol--glycerol-3-phosphate 3-phosphatidyltransferase, partial [Lachnospiraceae bacterium]|nr:CDP-diacylglycerol--glycerol-3-phosphate 3-phosphatidyltransferase [Lachnospiraceae bacterium]